VISNIAPPGNALLAKLSGTELSMLGGLEPVVLKAGQLLESPDTPIAYVYFIDRGLVSVAHVVGNRRLEIGLVGFEGMTGTGVVLGPCQSINRATAQTEGRARAIASDRLRAALQASPSIRTLFLRYAHFFMSHCSQTALANGLGMIDERLARWLLSAQDRLLTDELRMTHDLIANVLGVRRGSLTISVQKLESKGLVKAARNRIEIVNREGLVELAGDFYGRAEAEYERFIGPLPRKGVERMAAF
jgi:CRP-like cAMP-binding protein